MFVGEDAAFFLLYASFLSHIFIGFATRRRRARFVR